MATIGLVTVGVVDGDVVEDQVVGLNTEALDGGVLDVETGDGRVVQRVGVEELRLGLAAVGSLAVPPAGTATVDDMAGSTVDLDVLTGEADEGTLPLLVTEGGLTLEGDLGAALEVGQIKSLTSGDLDVVKDDAGAGLLAGLSSRSGGEGAGRTALNELSRSSGSRRGGGDGSSAEGEHRQNGGTHFEVDVRSTDK